jgi:hypothetical protein
VAGRGDMSSGREISDYLGLDEINSSEVLLEII